MNKVLNDIMEELASKELIENGRTTGTVPLEIALDALERLEMKLSAALNMYDITY